MLMKDHALESLCPSLNPLLTANDTQAKADSDFGEARIVVPKQAVCIDSGFTRQLSDLGHEARKECQVTPNIEENASSEGKQAPGQDKKASPELCGPRFLRSRTRSSRSSSTVSRNALSKRECEVIRLLAEGMSNKEIAPLLSISITTVETYRARIMMKLDLHSLGQLIKYAVQNNLVQF
jgi:DNA-binding CsgD family transcriptional regulator